MQQNSILDLFTDDYKALSDMDGITGNKSDTNLKEYQSFTDLRFSKDKVITWIDWHPTIKGTCSYILSPNQQKKIWPTYDEIMMKATMKLMMYLL